MSSNEIINQRMKLLNKKIALLLLFAVIASHSYLTFDEFIQKYERPYLNDTQEYQNRKNIYEKNIAKFQNSTFEMAVNNFTDRTEEEIAAMKNLQTADVGTRLGRPAPLRNRLGYPVSLDWRSSGAVTSIKNQGTCGDCWAFAAAALAESKVIIDKRFTNTSIDLAEQYLLSCTSQSTCNGGFLEYATKNAKGLPSEATYPYTPFATQDSQICSAKTLSIAQNNSDYYNLSDSNLINLLQNGPVAISVDSTNWEYYGSGILGCASNSGVNHAVLLVGYTSTYWIIKNQWGADWGMSGYIHVTRNSTGHCSIGYSAHVLTGDGDSTYDADFRIGGGSSNQQNSTTTTNSTTALGLFSDSIRIFTFISMLIIMLLLA